MKYYLSILALIILTSFNSAHAQNEKTKTITFITTAICEECKERIEEKLNYTKGVIFAELNLENKMLTVKYKTALITEQQIKEVLASIGYSSDTVVRDKDAYLALPKCCRGESSCEPEK
ncbi:MAG: heavy-metal-associated domain-containing protein [Crocinitomicaceae bacterium]|nr:heavy-metal-associated domain-containing protein [Crocinitomicaceae bacterium]